MSDLLGACGQIKVHPVPQSPHLYHEGVDSILMSLNTSLIYNPVSPCFPEPFRPSPIPWGPIVHYQTDRQTNSWADLDVCQQPNGNLLFMLKIKLTSNLSPGPPLELPVSECCSQRSLRERKHHPALPHSHPGGGQRPPRLSQFVCPALAPAALRPKVASPTGTFLEGDRKEVRPQSPVSAILPLPPAP